MAVRFIHSASWTFFYKSGYSRHSLANWAKYKNAPKSPTLRKPGSKSR